jgi:bloom syndrome protein
MHSNQLSYEVRRKNKSSLEDIAQFIEEKYNGESGIIYCFSRSECERITEKLRVSVQSHTVRSPCTRCSPLNRSPFAFFFPAYRLIT